MSLWGGLTLQRAVIASRVNDPDAAYCHLERAAQVAARLGEGRNDYNTEFGPANVALHEIAVAVELGDAGRALRAAATVDTSGLSAERRAQDAHRRSPRSRPAPPGRRGRDRVAPGRGHQPRNWCAAMSWCASSSPTCSPCKTRHRPSCGTLAGRVGAARFRTRKL